MEPDVTDWKIIDILREEYQPNNTIAKQLGVSEGMVRRRLGKLKESGIVKIQALINPDVLARQQVAAIAVNVTDPSQLDTKAKELSQLPHVLNVSIVTGRYDIMVEVLLSSNRGLVKFLTEVLPQVKGISATESFLLLKSYEKFV